MQVAVFGSRQGVPQSEVDTFVQSYADSYPGAWLISTGQRGVPVIAEQTALAHGLNVLSYRAVKIRGGAEIPDEYGVEEWVLGEQPSFRLLELPTFEDWQGAALYRSLMMVDAAERGVAFHADGSLGTAMEIGFFEDADKPISVKGYLGGTLIRSW